MSPVSVSSSNKYRSVGDASSQMGLTSLSLMFDGLPDWLSVLARLLDILVDSNIVSAMVGQQGKYKFGLRARVEKRGKAFFER